MHNKTFWLGERVLHRSVANFAQQNTLRCKQILPEKSPSHHSLYNVHGVLQSPLCFDMHFFQPYQYPYACVKIIVLKMHCRREGDPKWEIFLRLPQRPKILAVCKRNAANFCVLTASQYYLTPGHWVSKAQISLYRKCNVPIFGCKSNPISRNVIMSSCHYHVVMQSILYFQCFFE